MVYISLIFWMFLLSVTSIGLYRLWTKLVGGKIVDILMLPATIISELLYSLGRIMTGRPAYGGLISPNSPAEDACRHAISGRRGFFVSMLSSFFAISGVVIVITCMLCWLDSGLVSEMFHIKNLQKTLPVSFEMSFSGFWSMVGDNVKLLDHLCNAIFSIEWTDWRTPVFVYGIFTFSVRIIPARHDPKASIIVVLIMGGLFITSAAMFEGVKDLLAREMVGGIIKESGNLWYALTLVWIILLLLLCVTLFAMGVKNLINLFIPNRIKNLSKSDS